MKIKIALMLGMTMLGAPVAAQSTFQPVTDAMPAPTMEQVLREADERFAAFQRDVPSPGVVWGVVRDGRLVHVRGYGASAPTGGTPIVPGTLFRIASMSKAFTALAILKLRDDGRLRLDDLAEQHIPEMRTWRYSTADAPRIRVRDLLAHVGGLVTDDPWGDRQQVLTPAEFTAIIANQPPMTRTPQLSMEYSNYGYALLGRIVTNVSGRPYQRYIVEEIMRPLGMSSTGYDVMASPQQRRAIGYRWVNGRWELEPTMRDGEFGAMGGVETSAEDYAKWVTFLLSAWPARDGPETGPVRRSTVREMAQGLNYPRLGTRPRGEGQPPCPVASAYAMGLIATQDCELGYYLTHSGGYPGYGSYMMFFPERGIGIFGFANRTYTSPRAQVIDAAVAMNRAGLMPVRAVPVSDALARAYRTAGEVYAAGTIEPARSMLAMNFLMDAAPETWAATLRELNAQVGTCRTDSPIVPDGALAGLFDWECERGRLQGRVLLAPTNPATIQALNFRSVVSPPAQ